MMCFFVVSVSWIFILYICDFYMRKKEMENIHKKIVESNDKRSV